jgi:3-(3-hydroxy-phenyl)propionate hydroxylase
MWVRSVGDRMGEVELVSAHRVLVVGAGPVGLAAALALRARGLPATVVEAEPEERPRPGSRAIFVHRESLELLERMRAGLGWELAAEGLVWSTKRTFWGDREVYRRTYPPPDPTVLPHSTNLPQVTTERLLHDACKAAGVEFLWDAPVSGVAPSPDGVELLTARGDRLEADYVIGADGARSAVRREIGVTMEGSRSENSFVIVDVEECAEDPLPLERHFYYGHPAVGRRNVLLVPFAGGWRADLQCHPGDDPERFNDPDGVRRWLGQVMPARYADRVRWVSTYQFLQVVASDLADRRRRVLLVGEAAHLFAPFGARGMNSGFADAAAAAAAIQLALDAPDADAAGAAVSEFANQRRVAALYNRDAAGAALAHMQATDRLTRAKRRVAAELARVSRRAGAWLDAAPYGPSGAARDQQTGRY